MPFPVPHPEYKVVPPLIVDRVSFCRGCGQRVRPSWRHYNTGHGDYYRLRWFHIRPWPGDSPFNGC